MNCPRCKKPLRREAYEGVEIDRCTACQGIWLDNGEMREILDRREKVFTPQEIAAVKAVDLRTVREDDDEKDGLSCPNCDKTMNEYNYGYDSGIILDQCKAHGIWLDAEELEQVQIVVEEGMKRLASDIKRYAPILQKVEEECAARQAAIEAQTNPARFSLFRGMFAGVLRFL